MMVRIALWNRIVVPVLDLVCRAEKTTLTSPSGGVEISVCDGWCQAYKIAAGGFANAGFGVTRFYRDVLPAYERKMRNEGRFVEADELARIMPVGKG